MDPTAPQGIMLAVTYLLSHKALLAEQLLLLVGGCSVVVAVLSRAVHALSKSHPRLLGVDRWLGKAVLLLRWLATNRWLNAVAGTPNHDYPAIAADAERPSPPAAAGAAAKVLLPLLLAAGLLAGLARPARADVSTGPTIPLVRVDLAPAHATSLLAPGAGIDLAVGFLPGTIAGKPVDRLELELAGFVAHAAGVTSGSVAGLVCTLNSLLCAGAGVDVYRSSGARETFLLVSLGVEVLLGGGAPSSGPSSGPYGAPPGPPPAPPFNAVAW